MSTSDLDKKLLEETSDQCDTALCEDLLNKGAGVNAKDEDGCSPLLWAVLSGNIGAVQTLIDRGADIDALNNDSETPLHWAATSGNLSLAKLLVSKNADVNAKDEFGITPLRSATLNEDQEMVDFLRQSGAKDG